MGELYRVCDLRLEHEIAIKYFLYAEVRAPTWPAGTHNGGEEGSHYRFEASE
jgi:hypothetical protein